jgi:Zn-finger nucleic acid-binding protein
MAAVRVGTAAMHQCAQCGSAWLSPDAFAALCADRESRGMLAAAVGGGAAPARLRHAQRVRYVHCAVCHGIMNRVNFGRTSGIIIDVCKEHGVWFERDELRGVLAFIEQGGMERARERDEAEREEAMRAEMRRVSYAPAPALTTSIDLTEPDAGGAVLRSLLDALFR